MRGREKEVYRDTCLSLEEEERDASKRKKKKKKNQYVREKLKRQQQ